MIDKSVTATQRNRMDEPNECMPPITAQEGVQCCEDSSGAIGPREGGQGRALAECGFCRQLKMLDDPYGCCGDCACDDCSEAAFHSHAVMYGPLEHWMEKRGGRWFLMFCDRREGRDVILWRIEPPDPDQKLRIHEGVLQSPDPWHGYDGNGEIKPGWEW